MNFFLIPKKKKKIKIFKQFKKKFVEWENNIQKFKQRLEKSKKAKLSTELLPHDQKMLTNDIFNEQVPVYDSKFQLKLKEDVGVSIDHIETVMFTIEQAEKVFFSFHFISFLFFH